MSGSNSRYVDISTARSKQGTVSVVGVVVDVFGGIYKSRGSSSCITFTIKDCDLNNGHTWDGLKIKYFKDNENALPPVRLHDVILVRDIWVTSRHGLIGVASQDKNVLWAIFRPDPDPTSSHAPLCGPTPFEPTASERVLAMNLLNDSTAVNDFRKAAEHAPPPGGSFVQAAIPNSKPRAHRRLMLVQDIEERMFVDLVGEVVKMYTNDGEKVLLFFTDYTTNAALEDHQLDNGDGSNPGSEGDVYGYQKRSHKSWPGPAGRRTLQVTLWEPHAAYARQNLRTDSIITLSNVHVKQSRVDGILEAAIHTDRHFPSKLHVRRVEGRNDEGVEQFLQRKSEYWKANPRKRKQENEPQDTSKKPGKKQRKKLEKMEEGQMPIPHVTNKRNAPNEHVEAGSPSVPIQSLEAILSNKFHDNTSYDNVEYRLPFQNFCYRTTVRVVDFFPPRLEDFAVPQQANLDSDDEMILNSSNNFIRWEWRFCLLVESVPPPPAGQIKEKMRLFVAGPDAEYLLKITAVNLRKNSQQLEILRQKLFHLWGDLEERKREALHDGNKSIQDRGLVSSRPFNCCLQEYGVICRHRPDADSDAGGSDCSDEHCFGWERRFSMFLTTIRD
ncbi:telomere-binding alpha subunit central domain protein [Aspergillus heteromorphus CBS 117.55]|uniref:Protection of telomeres protein 1 n=1 Tax=Aspergillus heteromorphus CBS 117.55 TaxID=1448321 RepID=A0A317WXM0_9EURO|nr:telomere-binding alpha subunit central domain protein [Aspergillus heteromorphus CBS 117.55]PWY88990.1 telomere-binding alpha subunit central domain protein [Aspergillus heteromorphus CBS 117.55]